MFGSARKATSCTSNATYRRHYGRKRTRASPVRLTVDSSTQFFLSGRRGTRVADATPIGQGTTFLTNKDIVRGFKVHASVVDPPRRAAWWRRRVDIEIAQV